MAESFNPEFEPGEWVEMEDVSPIDVGKSVEAQAVNFMKSKNFAAFAASKPSRTVEYALNKGFNGLFKNGLKNADVLTKLGSLKFSFEGVLDEKEASSESTLLALAYHLVLPLVPFRQKDGLAGNYRRRFIVRANLVGKRPAYRDYSHPTNTYIETFTDPRETSKIQAMLSEQIKATRQISQMEWANGMRTNLARTGGGGAPSLGKRRN